MKNLFLILMVVGLALSSCSKEEKTPSVSETSVHSPAVDRDYTLLETDGGTVSFGCGWSDGYGSGQVPCAGTRCALATMTLPGGNVVVGIACFNGAMPLHTDNYR